MNKTVGTTALPRLSCGGWGGDDQLSRPRGLTAMGAPGLIQRDSGTAPGGNARGDRRRRMLAGEARDRRGGERMQF